MTPFGFQIQSIHRSNNRGALLLHQTTPIFSATLAQSRGGFSHTPVHSYS